MKLAMPVSLMELLAIPLGCPKTATKWLVITSILWVKQLAIRPSPRAGKSLVISQHKGEGANESLREFHD
jgi:hypothetical protein